MMTIRRRDAAALRARLAAGPLEAAMTVRAEVTPGAAGHNVVGYLEGDEPGPIVIGAHHDGWFRAAFDNATGVAALLAIARALAAVRPPPAPPPLLHLADRRGVRARWTARSTGASAPGGR